jgi:DHA2 family multidrug resistance protein-like MFS transporter
MQKRANMILDEGLVNPARTLAFMAVAIAVTLATLDSTVVNVALPILARDLQVDAASSVWVVNAYQLTVAICLLPFASLAESRGYRCIYLAGLAVFTLASLLCALSTSFSILVAARVLQGIGGAAIMSVNIALLRFIYPSSLLGSGVGNAALVVAVSAAAGPGVAAAILSIGSWPYLFVMNVPLGLLAFFIAARTLPENPRSDTHFDWRSAVLNALTLGLLVSGITGFSNSDESVGIALILGGAVLSGIVFVWHQTTIDTPLLPLDLLRRPVFALSMLTSTCSFAAQSLAYVSLPFYFYNVLGRSMVETGFLMMPWPVAVAVLAPISGRLADHYSPAILGGIGLAVLALGLGLLASLPPEPLTSDIAWRLAICGAGFGLFQSPNIKAILTSTPRERSGSAGGMQATVRVLGQSIGAALAVAVFNIAPHSQTTVSLWVAAVLSGIGCVLGTLRAFNKLRMHKGGT